MTDALPVTNPEMLLNRARDGGDQAVDTLLSHYRPYLKLLARLRNRRQLQAKYDDSDLVQETLVQVHRNLSQFRGGTEAEFAAWLRTLMSRVGDQHRRHYEAQKRDANAEQQLEQQFEESSQLVGRMFTSAEGSPSEQVSRRERAVVLSQALMQLPDDYREALILNRFEGLSMSQVAERMGRTVDSVQKLLARGVVELRRLMEDRL
ncbi:sigma-70 family RNA polymerase sigma factor [Bythopirellula polymerisocia]|uniref:ECF RNA polymerase sigma factor SigR n=1 Tax=Bythopirellula polymerisocia TaxID=2528003 RepID=A0A5C6CVI0_9BACT|nr:sigma-70 family RNA polymerase sigma factor [Bythopirellula polymerisocia]TWU28458.1 ECF RNA polymerase sigma factor SigR [Bythopirellula polymerisocia]